MPWKIIPKEHPASRVGRFSEQYPYRLSDLVVVTDVVDAGGATLPDALVPRRLAVPLPDSHFTWLARHQVADMAGDEPDLSTLGPYLYVRQVDAFDLASVGFAHGFVSEVVAVPNDIPLPIPNIGDYIVHYEPNTFRLNEDYSFVSIYDPNISDLVKSYVAKAVLV